MGRGAAALLTNRAGGVLVDYRRRHRLKLRRLNIDPDDLVYNDPELIKALDETPLDVHRCAVCGGRNAGGVDHTLCAGNGYEGLD